MLQNSRLRPWNRSFGKLTLDLRDLPWPSRLCSRRVSAQFAKCVTGGICPFDSTKEFVLEPDCGWILGHHAGLADM
jgi:hypothetical protein